MSKKVVFMGNSLVNGFPFNRAKSFPGIMRRRFKEMGEDFAIVNCGVNGESSAKMIKRFEKDVIDRDPEYVFIACGTNDFLYRERGTREVFDNIEKMAQMAEANGRTRAIIITSPFVHQEMASRMWLVGCGLDYAKVNEQIKELRDMIIASGRVHFDLHSIYPEFGEYLDGLHPTEAGYEFIADKLIEWMLNNLD